MSRFSVALAWYTARISEYVIPPATNTIRRCFVSAGPPVGRPVRCQLGFADRKLVAGAFTTRVTAAGVAGAGSRK